jgi:hypothetical protein
MIKTSKKKPLKQVGTRVYPGTYIVYTYTYVYNCTNKVSAKFYTDNELLITIFNYLNNELKGQQFSTKLIFLYHDVNAQMGNRLIILLSRPCRNINYRDSLKDCDPTTLIISTTRRYAFHFSVFILT